MRHPLHPALVHFPIACWSLATAADAAGLAGFGGASLTAAAAALLAIGVAAGLAAMLAGLFEFVRLGNGHPAEPAVQRHMAWALAAWTCYAASLFLRLDGMHPVAPGVLALGLGALGFGCLAVTGWLGGTLVYTHGVGARASAEAIACPPGSSAG
jgi:uncharacterized membrane protein